MKIKDTLIIISGFLMLITAACDKSRQVVAYDFDPDEVYKPMAPNDDNSEILTFGPANTQGFMYDFEIATSDSDVYVYLQDFTLLDIKPEINDSIFSFISEEMKENGFLSDDFVINPSAFSSLISQGKSYIEAGNILLAEYREDFDSQIEKYGLPLSPFHIYFLVYPVYMDENYVTYRQSAYSFTGGAHGMSFSYMKSYNLKEGNLVTVNDIIRPEGLEAVREEVASHMAYSYPIYENITTVDQYIDSLNVWLDHYDPMGITGDITLQNFPLPDPAITKEGLVFVYEMYELTPGSDGCPIVLIPYKDIKKCLKIPA